MDTTETTGLEPKETAAESANDPAGGLDSAVDQNGEFQGEY